MMTIRNYVRAKSLEEAYELNQKRSSRIIGGMLWMKMMNTNVGTVIDLSDLGLILTSDNAGHEATVAVSGDFGDSDAMVFAAVLKEGIKATLKKVAEVAVEGDPVAL